MTQQDARDMSKDGDNFAREIDSLPPHNIPAEMSCIASMMLCGGGNQLDRRLAFTKVREIINRDSFFQADHAIIFDVLCELDDQNKAIDAVIVRSELEKRHLLEEVGGTRYLGELLSQVPSAAHLMHYAGIVAEHHSLRKCISLGDAIKRKAYAPHAHKQSDEILDYLAAEIVKLQRQGRPSGIITIGEAARGFLARRFADGPARIYCGLSKLDNAMRGFARKRTHVIGGRPGSGKSQLGKQLAKNMATGVNVCLDARAEFLQPPIPIGLISIEEDRDKIAVNMLSNASGVANNRIAYGTANIDEWDSIEASVESLDDLPFHIEDSAMTLSGVRAAATRLVLEHKCQVILVDYLQLIDPEIEFGNEAYKVGEISKGLTQFGKQMDVVMILMAQLNRANEKDQGKKKIRKPLMSDLRSSGQIEQDSSVILLLHREDYYRYKEAGYQPNHKLEVDVAKNKDGPPGHVPLWFDGATQSVRDYPEGEEAPTPEPPEDDGPSDEDVDAATALFDKV